MKRQGVARLAVACRGRIAAQVQIMYGLAGERRLTEWEVPWLPGYEGSRPVRVGNAAASAVPARRLWRGCGRAVSSPPRHGGA